MNLKEKIALNALKRRLDRGAITKTQARDEYKKITGQDPEGPEYQVSDDDENPDIDDENSVTDAEKKRLPGHLKASELVKAYHELGNKSQPEETSPEQVTDSQPDDLTVLQLLEASLEVLDVVDQKPLPEVNYADPNQERIDTERVAAKGKKK